MKSRATWVLINFLLAQVILSAPPLASATKANFAASAKGVNSLSPAVVIQTPALLTNFQLLCKHHISPGIMPEHMARGILRPERNAPKKESLRRRLSAFLRNEKKLLSFVPAIIIVMHSPLFLVNNSARAMNPPPLQILPGEQRADMRGELPSSPEPSLPRYAENIRSVEELLHAIRLSADEYRVADSDTWTSIARAFNTSVPLLRELNRTKKHIKLFRGKTILVPHYECFITISPTSNIMRVTIRGVRINALPNEKITWQLGNMRHRVATGAISPKTKRSITPLGLFTITRRVEKPTWREKYKNGKTKRFVQYGGKGYPYGHKATVLQTDKKFDFHPVNSGMGTQGNVSHGCIRLHDTLGEMLWLLVPEGAHGIVTEETLSLEEATALANTIALSCRVEMLEQSI